MNENAEKLCSVDFDCWLSVIRLRNVFLGRRPAEEECDHILRRGDDLF